VYDGVCVSCMMVCVSCVSYVECVECDTNQKNKHPPLSFALVVFLVENMSSVNVLSLFQNSIANIEVAWFSPTGWRVTTDCESVPAGSLVRIRVLKRSVLGSNADSFNDVTSATMYFDNDQGTPENVNASTDDLGNVVAYAHNIQNFNTDGTVRLSVYVEVLTPSGSGSANVPLLRKVRVSTLASSFYGVASVATASTNVLEDQETGIGLPGLTDASGAVSSAFGLTGLVTVWRQVVAAGAEYLFDVRQGYPIAQAPLRVWHPIAHIFDSDEDVTVHGFQSLSGGVVRWDSDPVSIDATIYDGLAADVDLDGDNTTRFCVDNDSPTANQRSLNVTVSAGVVADLTMFARQVTSEHTLFGVAGPTVTGAGPSYVLTGDVLTVAPLGQYRVVQRLSSGTVVRENVSPSTFLVLNAASTTAPTSDDVWVGSMFTVPAQDTVKTNDVVHVEAEVTCNGSYDPASVSSRVSLLTALITYRTDAARMQTGIRVPLRRVASTNVWRGYVEMGDELYRANLSTAWLGVTLQDEDACGNKYWKAVQCAQIKYVDVIQPQLLDAEVCLVDKSCQIQDFSGTFASPVDDVLLTSVVLSDAAWDALTVGSIVYPYDAEIGSCLYDSPYTVVSWDRAERTVTVATAWESVLRAICLEVGLANKFCGLCAGTRQRVAVPLGCVVDVAGVSELFIVAHWKKNGVDFVGDETRMFVRTVATGSTDFVDIAMGAHYEAYVDLCALNDAAVCFTGFTLHLRVAELVDELSDKVVVVSDYCQIWGTTESSYAVYPINTTDPLNTTLLYTTVDSLVHANVAAPFCNVETDGFSAVGFYWQNVGFAEVRVTASSIGPLRRFTFQALATSGSAVLTSVVLSAQGWAALAKGVEVNCASAFVGDAFVDSFDAVARTITLKQEATSTLTSLTTFYASLPVCTMPENMQVFVRVESFNDGQATLNYIPKKPYWRQMMFVRVNDSNGDVDLDASYWFEPYNLTEFQDAHDNPVLTNSLGRTRFGAVFRVVDRTCNYAQTTNIVSKIKNDPYASYAVSHAGQSNVGGFWLLDDTTDATVNDECCARWAYVTAGSTPTNAPILKEALDNTNAAVLVHVPIDAMEDAESGVLQSGASFQATVISSNSVQTTLTLTALNSTIARPLSSAVTCDSSCAHVNRAAALVYGNGAYAFTVSTNSTETLTNVIADWDVFVVGMGISGVGIPALTTVESFDQSAGEIVMSAAATTVSTSVSVSVTISPALIQIGKLLVRGAGQVVGGWAGPNSQIPAVGLYGASGVSIEYLVVESAAGAGLAIEGGAGVSVNKAHVTSTGFPLLISEGVTPSSINVIDELYVARTSDSTYISAPYINGAAYTVGTTNASASNVDVPAHVALTHAGACSLTPFNCTDLLHPYRLVNTVVNDDITSDTTWYGIVQVNCECIVHAGVTLTIEPGTEVRFAQVDTAIGRRPCSLVIAPGAAFIVNNSDATDAPVCFVPSPQFGTYPNDSGLWGGLIIVGGGNAYRGSPSATFQDVPTLFNTVYYDGFHILMTKTDGQLAGAPLGGVAPWSVTMSMKALNGGDLTNAAFAPLTTCAVSGVSDFRSIARDASALTLQVQDLIALMFNGLDTQQELMARCTYVDVEGALSLENVVESGVVSNLPYAPLVIDPETEASAGVCPPLITLYVCENECELTLLPLGDNSSGVYQNSLLLCSKYVIDVNMCAWFTQSRYPVALGALNNPIDLDPATMSARLIAYDEVTGLPVSSTTLTTELTASNVEQSPLRADSIRLTFNLPSWLPTFTSYRLQMTFRETIDLTVFANIDVLRFIHIARGSGASDGTCNLDAPYEISLSLDEPNWLTNYLVQKVDCTEQSPAPTQIYVRVLRSNLTADNCDYELLDATLTHVRCGEEVSWTSLVPTYDSETTFYTVCFTGIDLTDGYYKVTFNLINPSYALTYNESCQVVETTTTAEALTCWQDNLICVTAYAMDVGATTCLRNFQCYDQDVLVNVPTYCLGDLTLPDGCAQLFSPTFQDAAGGFVPYTPAYYSVISTVIYPGNVWMESEDGEYRVNVIVTRRASTSPSTRYLLTVRPWVNLIFINNNGWQSLGDCGNPLVDLSCIRWRLLIDVDAYPASFTITATASSGSNTLTINSGYPLPVSSQNPPLPGGVVDSIDNRYFVAGNGVVNTYPIALDHAVSVTGYTSPNVTISGVTTSELSASPLLLYHARQIPTNRDAECFVPIVVSENHGFIETVGTLSVSLFSPPYAVKQNVEAKEGESCLPPWLTFRDAAGEHVDASNGYNELEVNGSCITPESTLFVFEDTADQYDIIGFLKLSCGQGPYTICLVESDQDSAANVLRLVDGPYTNEVPIGIELATNPFPSNRNKCACIDLIVQDACCDTFTYRIFVVFVPLLTAVVKVCNNNEESLAVLQSSENRTELDWLQVCCDENVVDYSFKYQVNGEILMALSDASDECYAGVAAVVPLVSAVERTVTYCNNGTTTSWSPTIGSDVSHIVRSGIDISFFVHSQAQCNATAAFVATAADVVDERVTAGRWWSWCYQYVDGSKEIVSNGLYTTDTTRYLSDVWTVSFDTSVICASLCTEETFVSNTLLYTFTIGPVDAPLRKITFDVGAYILHAREYINKLQLGVADDCASTEALPTPSANYPVYDVRDAASNTCAVIADSVLNNCGSNECYHGLRILFFKELTISVENFDWREYCCVGFENADSLKRIMSRAEAYMYLGRCVTFSGGFSNLFASLDVYETNYVQGCGEGWFDVAENESKIQAYETQVVYSESYPCGSERPALPTEGVSCDIALCTSDDAVNIVVPTMPVAPTYAGATFRVGVGEPYDIATVMNFVANGDRIVLAEQSFTLGAALVVDKSVEITADGPNALITYSNIGSVINIRADNVYIHGFVIRNDTSLTDPGGISCCINADTMSRTSYGGNTNIRIENMLFRSPKNCIFLSGTNMIVTNCTFTLNLDYRILDTTIRSIFLSGLEGSSFITNNSFTTQSNKKRHISIFANTRADGIPPVWESGYKGSLVVSNNTLVSGGAVAHAYMTLESITHQSGPQATIAPNGEFNLFITDNVWNNVNYNSSPVLVYGNDTYSPMDFFGLILLRNNAFGERDSSTQEKGGIFFTRVSTGSFPLGSNQIYVANNTLPAVPLGVGYSSVMLNGDIIAVRENAYYDAPNPLYLGTTSSLYNVKRLERLPGKNFVLYTRACYKDVSDARRLKMVLPGAGYDSRVPDYYSAMSGSGQVYENVQTGVTDAWAGQFSVSSTMLPSGSCENVMNVMNAMKNVIHVAQVNPCNPQQDTYTGCVLNLYSFDWSDRLSQCIFPFVMSQSEDGNDKSIFSVSPRIGWGLCPPITTAVGSAYNPLLLKLGACAEGDEPTCEGSYSVTECSGTVSIDTFVVYNFCGAITENALISIGTDCASACPAAVDALVASLPNGGWKTGSQFALSKELFDVRLCRLQLPCFDGRTIDYFAWDPEVWNLEAECNNLKKLTDACWFAQNMQLAPYYVAPCTDFANVCRICEVGSFVAQAASAGDTVVYTLSVPSDCVAGVFVSSCSVDAESGVSTWFIPYGTKVTSVSYNAETLRYAVSLSAGLLINLPNDANVSIAYYGLATTTTMAVSFTVSAALAGALQLTAQSALPSDVHVGSRLFHASLKPGTVVASISGLVLTLSQPLTTAVSDGASLTYSNATTEENPLLLSSLYACDSPSLAPLFPMFKLYDYCYVEVTSCNRDLLCQVLQTDINLCDDDSQSDIIANFFNGHDLLGGSLSGVQIVKVENGIVYGRALPGAAKNMVHCIKLCMKCVTGDVTGNWNVSCGENRRLSTYDDCIVAYDGTELDAADQCWTTLTQTQRVCGEGSSADFCVMYPELSVNLHSSFDCSGDALSQRISVNQLFVQRNANVDAQYNVVNYDVIEPHRLSLTVLATDFTPASFTIGGENATRMLGYLSNNGPSNPSTVELIVQNAQWLGGEERSLLANVATSTTFQATFVTGSFQITLNAGDVYPGVTVTGASYLQSNTTVVSVSGATVTLSKPTIAAGANVTLTIASTLLIVTSPATVVTSGALLWAPGYLSANTTVTQVNGHVLQLSLPALQNATGLRIVIAAQMVIELETANAQPIAPVAFQASQPLAAATYLQLASVSDESRLNAGMSISGGGLPASATIASVDTVNHYVYVNTTFAQGNLPIAPAGTVYSAQPTVTSVRFMDSIAVGSDYLLPSEAPSRLLNATWLSIDGAVDPQGDCDAETQPVLDNDIVAAGSIEIDSAFPVRGGLVNNKIFNAISDSASDFNKISIHRALRVVLKDEPEAKSQSEFGDNEVFGSARSVIAPAGSPWYGLTIHSFTWSSASVGYYLTVTVYGAIRSPTGSDDAIVVEPGTVDTPSGYELHSVTPESESDKPTTIRVTINGVNYLALIVSGGVLAHTPQVENCSLLDLKLLLFNCSDSENNFMQDFPSPLNESEPTAIAFGVRNTIVSHADMAGHECLPYAVTLACDLVTCNDDANFAEFSSYQVRDATGTGFQRQDLYNEPTSASRAFFYVFATVYQNCVIPSAVVAAPEFFYDVDRLGAQQSFLRADPAPCAPQEYLLLITSPGDGNVYVSKLLRNTFANSASMRLAVFRPSNGGLSVVRSAELVVRVSLGASSGVGDDWAQPRSRAPSAREILAAERAETFAMSELDRARTVLATTPQWIETDRTIMLAARGGARRVTKERVPNPAFDEAQVRVERATIALTQAQANVRSVSKKEDVRRVARNGAGLDWTECVYFYMPRTEFATTELFYKQMNNVLRNLPMVNPDKVDTYVSGVAITASDLLCYKISLRINDGPELPAIPLTQCVLTAPDAEAWDARIFPHTVEQVHVSGATTRALDMALVLQSHINTSTLFYDVTNTVQGHVVEDTTQTYTSVYGGSVIGCPNLKTHTVCNYNADMFGGIWRSFSDAGAAYESLQIADLLPQDASLLTNQLQRLKYWITQECILKENGTYVQFEDATATPQYALDLLKLLYKFGAFNYVPLYSNYTGVATNSP